MTDKKSEIETILGSCRMYESEYPEIDDTVMVKVTSTSDMGADVILLEYNLPGFISTTHYSRKRIRSIKKIIGEGKEYVLHVINLDKNANVVDLSKKMVTSKEEKACKNRFKKCRKVHSILANVAFLNGISLEQVYEKFGWKLYHDYNNSPCDAFQMICNDEPILDDYIDLSENIKDDLIKLIKRQFTVKPKRFSKSFQLMSLDRKGVETILECLGCGEKKIATEFPKLKGFKIISNGAPAYELTLTAKNQAEADGIFKIAIEAISEKTKEYNKTYVQ